MQPRASKRSAALRRSAGVEFVRDSELRQSRRDSLNRLCDISDWRPDSRFARILRDLGEGVYIHRKAWEYGTAILGLESLGAVGENSTAIAVGAGSERPLYYFANRIAEMVATDLYDDPDHEGTPLMLSDPARFAPFEYRRGHLTVEQMDGRKLAYPDDRFDFGFSLSSIEHFGTREDCRASMREMSRVLKPGGHLCIITELILNDASHPEYFTLDEIGAVLIETPGLRLVGGDLDLRISRSLVENPINLDVEKDHQVSPHIVLYSGGVLWTSLSLFFQKEG